MTKLREWISSEIAILGIGLSICVGVLFIGVLLLIFFVVMMVISAGKDARYVKDHCQPTEQTQTESGVRIHNAIIGKTIISQPVPYTETRRLYVCDDGKSVWY